MWHTHFEIYWYGSVNKLQVLAFDYFLPRNMHMRSVLYLRLSKMALSPETLKLFFDNISDPSCIDRLKLERAQIFGLWDLSGN